MIFHKEAVLYKEKVYCFIPELNFVQPFNHFGDQALAVESL